MNIVSKNYEYICTIQVGESTSDTVTITDQTIQFLIKKDLSSTINSAQIIIKNLSQETRDSIYQDYIDYIGGDAKQIPFREIRLSAGAGNDLYEIFSGNITQSRSMRSNQVDIDLAVSAYDGEYGTKRSVTSKTLEVFDYRSVFDKLVGDLQNIKLGSVGDIKMPPPKRSVTLLGNTYELLTEYFEGVFIDDMKLNLLNTSSSKQDYVGSSENVLTSQNGLLGTPIKEGNKLTVETLFAPSIGIGQIVSLKSIILPQVNGTYRADGLLHQGTISPTNESSVTTTLYMIVGGNLNMVGGGGGAGILSFF